MSVLDAACGGLLPLVPGREDMPALRDDFTAAWITRREVRRRALAIADALALPYKGLVFLLASNRIETVMALLGAAAWVGALFTTRTKRQHLSFDMGRASMISIVSPMCDSFFSSWT